MNSSANIRKTTLRVIRRLFDLPSSRELAFVHAPEVRDDQQDQGHREDLEDPYAESGQT